MHDNKLLDRLDELVTDDDRSPRERRQLITLMAIFYTLPAPPGSLGLLSAFSELQEQLRTTIRGDDSEALEQAFLDIYCYLHGQDKLYSPSELQHIVKKEGYSCLPGGLSPILKAGPFISAETVSADFGAGNGLQGLLLQKLYPHRKTIQIEISSQMVAIGKKLQIWLGIPQERVEWIVGDIFDFSPVGIDFIYLYLPVRAKGTGTQFYEKFSSALNASDQPVVIFSVADYLRPFLSEQFHVIYHDGHLTCYRKADEKVALRSR